jgi:phage-related protein
VFHPGARAEIRAMPQEIRLVLGKALLALQYGHSLSMPHSRPMPEVAAGVEELRVKDRSGQYRVFYLKKFSEGICVLHAFMKKSRETPMSAIELAQRRQGMQRETS